MPSWHDDDRFWLDVSPFLFSAERWARAAGEVDGVLALLGLAPGATILDAPCGVGRHSLELARRGYRVTGIDRTAAYLDEARRRAAAEGLAIRFEQRDLRALPRDGAFDAAINLYTSFGYFDDPGDDERVATSLFGALRPGGRLVLDLVGTEVLARVFRAREWQEAPDGTVLLSEARVRSGFGAVDNRWVLIRPDGTRREHAFTLRVYSAGELSALLRRAGFVDVTALGSLAGAPYDHAAERLVLTARRG